MVYVHDIQFSKSRCPVSEMNEITWTQIVIVMCIFKRNKNEAKRKPHYFLVFNICLNSNIWPAMTSFRV